MPKTAEVKHPYITKDRKISSGSPIVSGTRVRVVDIVIEYDRLGLSPDQIVDAHPQLTLEAVHDALSFYYENREAIDGEISNRKENLRNLSHKFPSKLKAAIG